MAAFDSFTQVQPVLDYAARHLDDDLSLAALAEQAGISPFHLHRVFSAAVGESPKQLTLRLRLERAAVLLLTTRDSVLDIALACGFQTHESFTRAFQRRFRIAPRAYRQRGFAASADPGQHADAVRRTGLCVSLYRISRSPNSKEQPVSYTVTRQEVAEQPVLLVRRRVKRSDIGPTIAETLPHIFAFAQQHAIPLTGHPLTRYPEMSLGLITMEACMRISAQPAGVNGSGEVEVGTLPAGPAAVTTHTGPYETLGEAYAAVEQWMESQGVKPGGAPWESQITDPGENPDPATWKTEIFWPLAR